MSSSGSHVAGSQDSERTNYDADCNEWGCGFFGPKTVKENSGGVAINQRLMKDVAEIAKEEEEEDANKRLKETAQLARPLTTGSRGLSMLASDLWLS